MTDETDSFEGGSLSEKAYRHILDDILAARLAAGAPIQERRLAAAIALSRSPVRDALGRLAGEGLLVRSDAGVLTVRAISLSDYLQSLDMRALLEPAAAGSAAASINEDELRHLDGILAKLEASDDPAPDDLSRFDDDLHGTIAARSGNPFMQRTLTEMRRYTSLYERQAKRRPLRHADGHEHRAIVAALAARSAEAANEAMRRHLAGIRRRILDQF